jgi:hypothetical protein
MAPTPRYGSIPSYEQVEVELLPTGEAYIGTVDDDEIGQNATNQRRRHRRRHHFLLYTLAAFTCLFAARYWHARSSSSPSQSNDGTGEKHNDNSNGPASVRSRSGRVPMPPALSNLDPASDLGFRSTTRSGLALPSKAWGEHYSKAGEDGKFTALPTNEWYLVRELLCLIHGLINAFVLIFDERDIALLFCLHTHSIESPLACSCLRPLKSWGDCTCLYHPVCVGSCPTASTQVAKRCQRRLYNINFY